MKLNYSFYIFFYLYYININGANITLKNGKASTTIKNVQAGDLTIKVTYFGDDKYLNSSSSTKVNIYAKKDANLIVTTDDVKVGETAIVNIEINPDVAGKVTADGKEVSISKGKGTYSISNLVAGTYSIVVKFAGDKYFNACEKTVTFNVINAETPANDTNASSGNATDNNSTSGGVTDNNNTGANGTGGNVNDNNNTGANGTGGNENNNTNTTITKVNPNLSVNVADVNVGETIVVNVSINENVSGNVIVSFNGVDHVVSVSKGKGTYNIPGLAAGKYSAVVGFAGDDKFNASEKTVSFNVIKSETPLNNTNATDNKTDINNTVEPEIIIPVLNNASDNISFVISLPEDATGTVTMTVDGKDYVFDVSEGVANVELPELDEGNHQYTITYSGDAKYSGFANKGSMNVNSKETGENASGANSVIMIPSLDEPFESGSVVMRFPADASGKVTLTVDGKDYVFNVSNGVANVELPKLGDGDYNYTITYSGDDKYSSFTKNDQLKISSGENPVNNNTGNSSNENTSVVVDPVIKASNVTVTYAAGSDYTITVYGTDGKLANDTKVVITVKGKTFKTLTTTNGVAKFKVTNAPGTYKMTIKSLGKSVTKTLKVKHLVTLKSVTLKKSAKKLTLKATLAKVKGKYLKKKTITFKINGKKVATAKTNSKGVAQITIKNPNVVKNLKVGKKVTYQATYLKDTAKKTTKIKK